MVQTFMATENITFNDHNNGFLPTAFETDPYLMSNFSVLGTSFDSKHNIFAAIIETIPSLGLNWFGTQFHPEKPQYEFDGGGATNELTHEICKKWTHFSKFHVLILCRNIPHNRDAIISNQYLVEFFLEVVRSSNDNTFKDEQELNDLVIYNYQPLYYQGVYPDGLSFEQTYSFVYNQTI